ncbi:MAG: site-specific integrase [Cellulosilyticum sp.]|nr:site-specific integrase [Cellulosilyticum sp.]
MTKKEKNITWDKKRNRYCVELRMGKREDGRPNRPKKYFKTLKEAKQYRNQLWKERDSLKKNRVLPSKQTLDEYCQQYLEYLFYRDELSPTTLAGYKNILKHITNHKIGSIKLFDISYRDMMNYEKDIAHNTETGRGLSKTTINKHFCLLQSIFKQAMREKLILENPLCDWKKYKEKPLENNSYNSEECRILINAVKGTTIELPVIIAILTGMRRGEILGLKWEDVDLDNRIITIRNNRVRAGKETLVKCPKSESSRRKMYISDYLYNILIKEKDRQQENKEIFKSSYDDNGYVFCKEDGSLYSVDHITKMFSKILERHNLRPITFHGLRHSFATILSLEGNVDVVKIQRALGQSSIAITEKRYIDKDTTGNKVAMEYITDKLDLERD